MSQSINEDFADRKQKLSRLKKKRAREVKRDAGKPEQENRCPACKEAYLYERLAADAFVCERCGHHYKISHRARFELLFDRGSASELFREAEPRDPIGFPGYSEKLADLRNKTGMRDAAVAMRGQIGGIDAVAAVLDSSFLMGSMGTAVGETVSLTAEYAAGAGLPLIIFSASGGARMQEGIFSLMQMAKTAAAIRRFSDAGGLYISYLTNPTTGGVTASFASLGDVTLAEPGALIGFAGPRVIEQTMKASLPEGFQRARFQQEHGFADAVVRRGEMKRTVVRLLRLHGYGAPRERG